MRIDWNRWGLAVGRSHGVGRLAPVLLVCFLSLAGGCSSTPGGTGDQPGTDIVTDSDEPESRKRARLRLELASNYFAEGKTTVALDEVKQSLAADPLFPDAYNLRGLIYQRLGDARQAEDSFKRALSINPRDGDTLHNYGVMLCELRRFPEASAHFERALANPLYGRKGTTYLLQGMCQIRAGQRNEAEQSLLRAYELDASNPVAGFNLATLLFQRGEVSRAQFYIRRINNSDLANAQTLWLGVKVENRLGNTAAFEQLADQLRKRYPQSRELGSLNRRAFDE